VLATKTVPSGDAAFPDGVYELSADGEPVARASVREGDRLHLNPFTGRAETVPVPAGAVSSTGPPAGRAGGHSSRTTTASCARPRMPSLR
jgi:hypothetical protein